MVIGLIRPVIVVAQQVYKHRKAIYAVLTAQDRYISKSFRYGGYGKATSYGVRSGALAGSIAGAFINNASESPGNGISSPFRKQPKASKPYKTRNRFAKRSNRGYSDSYKSNRYRRCPRYRRY